MRVVELEPPSVATDLMPGQRDSDIAMPLDDFADEVMSILRDDPDVTEVQVERMVRESMIAVVSSLGLAVSTASLNDRHSTL